MYFPWQSLRRLGTPYLRTQSQLELMDKGGTKCLSIQVHTEYLELEGQNCQMSNAENKNDSANVVLDPILGINPNLKDCLTVCSV